MDLRSFSHGQIHSKIWLCEQLEKYLKNEQKIIILGCWHNILGMILMIRNPYSNFKIKGIDIDQDAIELADSFTEAWRFEYYKPFDNECADANLYNYDSYDVIINTSVEHMDTTWFERVSTGQLVCVQSSNIGLVNESNFQITNPNTSIETFKEKYPLAETLYLGEKHFNYDINPYTRFCHIGYK